MVDIMDNDNAGHMPEMIFGSRLVPYLRLKIEIALGMSAVF